MADTGIALISTNELVMLSANALMATRRPLISTKVASGPIPLRDTEAAPFAVESWLLLRVEKVPAPVAGMRSSNCCKFSYPMPFIMVASID